MLPIVYKKLRKDKAKNGKLPVVLQVYHNNQRKQIFTGIYVDPAEWDETAQEATGRDSGYINRLLSAKQEEVEQRYLKQSLEGKVNIKISDKISKRNYFEYSIDFYKSKKNTASKTYIDRCVSKIEDFRTYAGDLSFNAISPQLLKDYENHLFEKGNQRNTINGIFKRLRQPFNQAVREGIIDANPFNLFKAVTYKQGKREYLTMEEIHLLENAKIPPQLEYIRDYFLLSCYTGLRFSDVQNFDKKKSIVLNKGVERIIIGTTKTGEVISIKLSPRVKAIIERLNRPLPTNIHTNRLLRIVGEAAGIEKRLTYHMSRHAAAVNMAAAGISIEVVARILGHSNIRTTSIYYKITDSKLDEAMDQFQNFH